MLEYSVDLEILSDLYDEYMKHSGDGAETIRRLGRSYEKYIQDYSLTEESMRTIRMLARCTDEKDQKAAQERLIRARAGKKAGLRKEKREYKDFCSRFSGETALALRRLPDLVFGRSIPYRLKNRCLNIDIASCASFSLSVEFSDVLIEDGRHPKEIVITHLSGEDLSQREKAIRRNETGQAEDPSVYRISFINSLCGRDYPSRISSFTCSDIKGRIRLYDYSSYPGQLSPASDKIPYRRLYYLLDSIIYKYDCLAQAGLNDKEKNVLPLFRVFHQLTGLYLDKGSHSGARPDSVTVASEAALRISLAADDMDLTCRVLKENGFHDLSSALREAKDDRKKLGRFYIYYAASKRSADLYSFLMGLISGCSEGYKRHPLPLSYRKFHAMTRKMLDRDMARRGWSGSFPCFFIKSKAGKIPVKSVYSKKYDYENEKSYYVDFMESVSDTSYTIMALTGQILRRPDEEASDFCALDCCFLDGGRRESRMFGSITMNGQESAQQVLDAAVLMAERVTKSVRG